MIQIVVVKMKYIFSHEKKRHVLTKYCGGGNFHLSSGVLVRFYIFLQEYLHTKYLHTGESVGLEQ